MQKTREASRYALVVLRFTQKTQNSQIAHAALVLTSGKRAFGIAPTALSSCLGESADDYVECIRSAKPTTRVYDACFVIFVAFV